MSEAKIAALKEEIESIRFADALYWKLGKDCSREASAEYNADKIGCQKSGAHSHCCQILPARDCHIQRNDRLRELGKEVKEMV